MQSKAGRDSGVRVWQSIFRISPFSGRKLTLCVHVYTSLEDWSPKRLMVRSALARADSSQASERPWRTRPRKVLTWPAGWLVAQEPAQC